MRLLSHILGNEVRIRCHTSATSIPDFLFIMPCVLHRVCTNVSSQETVAEKDFVDWLSHHHVGEMIVTLWARMAQHNTKWRKWEKPWNEGVLQPGTSFLIVDIK